MFSTLYGVLELILTPSFGRLSLRFSLFSLTTYGSRLLADKRTQLQDNAATRSVPSSGKSSPMSMALTQQAGPVVVESVLASGFYSFGLWTASD